MRQTEKPCGITVSDVDHAVESSFVVADGVVYIGSGTGNVYAFGNPTISKASEAILILIETIIAVIIVATAAILIFKRLRSKPFLQKP